MPSSSKKDWSTPPNPKNYSIEFNPSSGEVDAVKWKRSPNTARKKAAAQQAHPDIEIHALQGILAQVQTGNKRKRDDDGSQRETPAAVSAQLLNSWLTVSNEAGGAEAGLSACLGDSKKTHPSQEQVQYLQKKIATLNTTSGQDNLLNLLTKLEQEMVVPPSTVVPKARNPQTKTDKFRDKLMAARRLREKKKLEAQIRQNLRHNVLHRPRADQIPITYLNPKPNSSNLAYLSQSSRQGNPGRNVRKPAIHSAAPHRGRMVPSRAAQIEQTKVPAQLATNEGRSSSMHMSKVPSCSQRQHGVQAAARNAPASQNFPSTKPRPSGQNISTARIRLLGNKSPQQRALPAGSQRQPTSSQSRMVRGDNNGPSIDKGQPHINRANLEAVNQAPMDEDALFLQAMAAAAAKYDKPTAPKTTAATAVEQVGHIEDILSQCSGSCSKDSFARFKVHSVTKERGSGYFPVLNTTLVDCSSNETVNALLTDEWGETPLCSGDFINIVWSNPKEALSRPIRVTAQRNLLILCPDLLVSPTRITGAVRCTRRSVLAEQVQNYSASKYTALGNAKHELVERALMPSGCGEINSQRMGPNFETAYLRHVIDDVVKSPNVVEELFATGLTVETTRQELLDLVPSLQAWARESLTACGSVAGPSIQFCNSFVRNVVVHRVLSTEEKIWSPMWGLKGQIDIMAEAGLQVPRSSRSQSSRPPIQKKAIIPLELKTGYTIKDEHHAQVTLYSLLLKDRYKGLAIPGTRAGPAPMGSGLLLHLPKAKQPKLEGVSHIHAEIKQLLLIRNRFVAAMASDRYRDGAKRDQFSPCELPSVTGNVSGECNRCFQKSICMLYHRSSGGTCQSSGLREEEFEALVGHLTKIETEYFTLWNTLLDMEASFTGNYQREIWTLTGAEREALGRCISGMKLVATNSTVAQDQTGSKLYVHTFERHRKSSIDHAGFSVGGYVTISIEGAHVGIMSGRINSISSDQVCVSSSHALRIPEKADLLLCVSWRIDQDEMFTGIRMVKNNIVQLFTVDPNSKQDHFKSLRDLVVSLHPPRIRPDGSEILTQLLQTSSRFAKVYCRLNLDQKKATKKVLEAEDYVCIEGMPGTGKTTTIQAIVLTLQELGKSVLISSYTHTAVDNLLLKLKQDNIDFVRLGRRDQVHNDLQEHLLDRPSLEQLRDLENNNSLVVGTTCLSIRHPLLQRKLFDYVIIDEAGQITQPVCIGPLLRARTFVLVGDQYQLPPLVKSAEAKEKGMEISLFKRLCDAHPTKTAELTTQFRMNEEIMSLCNCLVYDNKLKCGNEAVAKRRLTLARPIAPEAPCWLKSCINPAAPVVFLDTDGLTECNEKENKQNVYEAMLTKTVVDSFIAHGVDAGDMGIITPYRSQLSLLTHTYLNQHLPKLEVQTVDKYQGRDKDCIVISLVRSNLQRNVGNLLCDWRRINVAFTRAKSKLVLIGSARTLNSSPVFLKFLKMAREQDWILKLPSDAIGTSPQGAVAAGATRARKEVEVPPLSHGKPILRDIASEINSARNRASAVVEQKPQKPARIQNAAAELSW